MRISKEQKGLSVVEALPLGVRKDIYELMRDTGLPRPKVRQGIDWIRDYEPHALVCEREGPRHYYKLAENASEVAEHINTRARTLYRAALRLEKMVTYAYERWPRSQLLKIMKRHLTRMREDVEELV